jgi:hypothetical protein
MPIGLPKSLRVHALHCVSRLALRHLRLLEAKALVDRVARRFPVLRGASQAEAALRELQPGGSCLSRAVTVAAMLPGAEIVIGVDPWGSANLVAHAWLEVDGVRVDTSAYPDSGLPPELARLPPVSSRRGDRGLRWWSPRKEYPEHKLHLAEGES